MKKTIVFFLMLLSVPLSADEVLGHRPLWFNLSKLSNPTRIASMRDFYRLISLDARG